MINLDSPIYNTIVIYAILIAIILLLKPEPIYCSKTNKYKSFGIGENKTLFALPFVCVALVVFLYSLFMVLKGVNDRFVKV